MGTSWGKEPQIVVAQQGCCARLASCPRIVQENAGYRCVVANLGQWTSMNQGFGDYTEVQIVDEGEEVPPKCILQTFRGGARC